MHSLGHVRQVRHTVISVFLVMFEIIARLARGAHRDDGVSGMRFFD